MEKLLLKMYLYESKPISGKEITDYVKRFEEKYKDALPKYDLWQKYLKRSKKYKNVCEWIKDAYDKNPPEPEFTKHFEQTVYDFGLFAYSYVLFFTKKPHTSLEDFLDVLKFKERESHPLYQNSFFMWANNNGFSFENEMLINYFIFGNIYDEFNEFSTFRKLLILDFQSKSNVFEFHETMEWLSKMASIKATSSFVDTPTLDEFQTCLYDIIKDDFRLHITIANPDMNKDDILGRVSDIIDAKRNRTKELGIQYDKKLKGISSGRFECPTGNIRPDELKRYLKTYDLQKNGKTIKKISQILHPNSSSSAASLERVVLRDLQKAKKIIENVEMGFFPGNYQ